MTPIKPDTLLATAGGKMTESPTTHVWRITRANGTQLSCVNCGRWKTPFTSVMSCEELQNRNQEISKELKHGTN
jgi:hypothetical protein